MKLRLALSAFAYVAVLFVAALVVTGHLSLSPFTGDSQQVLALENDDSGSALLLCGGCYHTTSTSQALTVTVTVTVTINNGYNACSWGCYQPVQTYNACQWGCYTPQVYNNWNTGCNWGCNQQPVYWNTNNWNSGCNWGCNNNWGNASWNAGWNTGCSCYRYY